MIILEHVYWLMPILDQQERLRVFMTDIFDNKKGHNSHKNYPLAPNFELVQGLRNSNIQYEFDQNPLRCVGVRAAYEVSDGRIFDTGISMSPTPTKIAAGAPNFELVQGLRNSNIQYEFDN